MPSDSTDSDTSFEEKNETSGKSKVSNKSDNSKKRVRDEPNNEETMESKGPSKKSKYQKNSDGDEMIPIGKNRFVTVRAFKGKALIDIREFYEDKNGKLMPGRKGISLSREQYVDFKAVLGEIDARLDDL